MSNYSLRAICHLITIIFFLSVAGFGSQSNLLSNLAEFHSDKILLCMYIIAGYFLTQKILQSQNHFNFISLFLSSLYFYTAFCMFSDGHVGGWSHSKDFITEKIFMGLLISLITLFTIYIPIIAIMVAIAQNVFLKTIWRLQKVS